ncbi:MAG: hypothetical protein CMF23_09540 [Ignavibacteriae bacterium]|nr:hypothetical protein [Ignavibacteriota bacterium]
MIPLFTSNQIREIDNYAIKEIGIPSFALMENASLSIFNEIINNFPTEQVFGILVGKGNNGGDGLALARHLINNEKSVRLLFVDNPKNLKGDSLSNWKILENYNTTLLEYRVYRSKNDLNILKEVEVIIDSVLGTGAKGELQGNIKDIIEEVNELDAYKVAIDIPTGLNADTGFGELVFDSDLTITLAELKRGLFLEKGYKYSGKVVKGSIGISDKYFDQFEVEDYLIEPEDAFDGLPVKELDNHKYNSGKVLVIGGSFDLPGAPLLSGISALYSGAGAVVLAVPYQAALQMNNPYPDLVINKIGTEETKYFELPHIDSLSNLINWADSIVLGPGLSRKNSTKDFIIKLLTKFNKKKFVIDADALFLISDELMNLKLQNSVLTPHHGEFEKLSGISKEEFQTNLLKYGKDFSEKNSVNLVLKGSRTVIFNKNREAFINTTGNPGMAKFGSGDVLSGILGSFIAQSGDLESALISAVYLHSLSADILVENKTEYGITASEIMKNIPNAIKFLRNSIV